MGYSINSSIGSTTSSTRRSPKKVVAAILTGAMLSIVALAPAAHAADTAATATTFTLSGGDLGITAPGAAALNNANTGDSNLIGSFTPVAVTDARGGTAGWVVSAASNGFTGTELSVIQNAQVAYTAGTVAKTGDVATAASAALTAMGSPVAAVTATAVVGNNTAQWSPEITVTLPPNALQGDYAGTITHSIL